MTSVNSKNPPTEFFELRMQKFGPSQDKHNGKNDLGTMETKTTKSTINENNEVKATKTEEVYKIPSIESAKRVFESSDNVVGNGSQTQTWENKSIKDHSIKQRDGINSNVKPTSPRGYQTSNGSQTKTGDQTSPRQNNVHKNQQTTNMTSKNTNQNPKNNTVDIDNSKTNIDTDSQMQAGVTKPIKNNSIKKLYGINSNVKTTPSNGNQRGNGSRRQTVDNFSFNNVFKQDDGKNSNVKTTPPNRDQTFPRQNNGYGSDVHKNKQSTNFSNKNTDQNPKNNSIDINNSKVNNGPGESVTSSKKQEYTGNDQFNKTDKKQNQSKETFGNKKNIFENGGTGGATLNFKTSASGKNVGSSKVKEVLVGNVERNTSSTQPIYNVKKSVTHNKQDLSGEENDRLAQSTNKQEQQNKKVDIIDRNVETSDADNKKAHTKNICNNTSAPITNNITSPVKQNEKNINAPTVHASRSFTDEISEKVKSFSGDKGDPEFFQIDEALTIHNNKINNEIKYLASLKKILKLKKSGNDTSNAKLHNFTNHKSDQLNKFKERVSKFIIDPQDNGLTNELDTFMEDKLSELSKSKDLQTELGTKANQNKLKVSSLKKYKQILKDVQTDIEELRRELNSCKNGADSDYKEYLTKKIDNLFDFVDRTNSRKYPELLPEKRKIIGQLNKSQEDLENM